jgi:4-alpha-glucanotransferase
MGLSRLYWVPLGQPATEGAYIRYPEHDLMGILALESRRHDALVIGEDLGTVPLSFPDHLEQWGVLSSQVLYFERKGEDFRKPDSYSDRALVSVHTHDLPPLAGFLEGRDLDLRRRAEQIPSDELLEEARLERASLLQALLRRLSGEGLLDWNGAPVPIERFAAAVYAFLGQTPAPLLALSLDDLMGEAEPVNLPGISAERHPSWSRPLGVELETLARHPVASAIFEALNLQAG